jgi:integration host factor subunit beta
MTKSQLIDEIYQKSTGLTKTHLTSITETVFDAIKNSLTKGERVEIRGFGNFSLRKREARKA